MNKPTPSHFCLTCNAYHSLHYVLDSNNHKHLTVECPKGHRVIAMQPGLNIPVVESKRKLKLDAARRQPDLF